MHVQVSVARSFDAPIKLLFPRAMDLEKAAKPFSMLGLGDIVIPGVFVALLLRYDALQHFKTGYFHRWALSTTAETSVAIHSWADSDNRCFIQLHKRIFSGQHPATCRSGTYKWQLNPPETLVEQSMECQTHTLPFLGLKQALCCSAFSGYVLGLATTIVVMNVFEAAQPALLYIVPAVIGAVSAHAAYRNEFRKASIASMVSCKFQHNIESCCSHSLQPEASQTRLACRSLRSAKLRRQISRGRMRKVQRERRMKPIRVQLYNRQTRRRRSTHRDIGNIVISAASVVCFCVAVFCRCMTCTHK